MNAARSIDPPEIPADAAALAAASLTPSTPAANDHARDGWMAAYDAAHCTRDGGLWGVTFARCIQRALAAGDTVEADTLASIQQFVFDHQFAIAEAEIHAATVHLNRAQAQAGGA